MRMVSFFVFLAPALYCLPTNPVILSGAVSQEQSANFAEYTCSDRSVLLWENFVIDVNESLRFSLPSQDAAVLNRVSHLAQIDGSLFSNGQVYFSAPNGVVIGRDALIDVGSLLITTVDIDAEAFARGTDFVLPKENSLIRQGNISHHGVVISRGEGGKVYLNAPASQIDLVGTIQGGEVEVRGSMIGLSPSVLISTSENVSILAEQEMQLGGLVEGRNVSLQIASENPVHLLGKIKAEESAHVQVPNFINQGSIEAKNVLIETARTYSDVSKGMVSAPGGRIVFESKESFFASGSLTTSSEQGGEIVIHSDIINMAGAKVSADGEILGGSVTVGDLENTSSIYISGSTKISARGGLGEGGTVYVLSAKDLEQYGSISVDGKTKGGEVEISASNVSLSKENRLSALGDTPGRVYFDPKNITISSAPTGVFPQYELIDPTPSLGNNFGANILALSTGNVVVGKSGYNPGGAANAGAVYVYNGLTGELISALTSSSAADSVGGTAFTALTGNGNFVIQATNWDVPGGAANVGASIWGSGSTGVAGTVSEANSLIGSTTSDRIGDAIAVFSNGNYVSRSIFWNSNRGSLTWANGTTGITGTVSDLNSLVGSSNSDQIGLVTELGNGNYVITSGDWDLPGGPVNVGAVTWADKAVGVTGTISISNSLIGSSTGDRVGINLQLLTNDNYLVLSTDWDIPGGPADVGATTWADGTTGITGTVSALNSLIGSSTSDGSLSTAVALTNGNYVVRATGWDIPGGPAGVGAATWGDGTTGVTGTISALNSLIGSSTSDGVGSSAIALTNGNYVVGASFWDVPGGPADVGAATWGSGATGITGTVSALNSLIGSSTQDFVSSSSLTALTNDHYVVLSDWNIPGGPVFVGAATWGNGTTGITGTVSALNSLIGTGTQDTGAGSFGVTALTNGNYVVLLAGWTPPGGPDNVGAATWGNGTTGVTGTISVLNSLAGSTGFDLESSTISTLDNGNYVVLSQSWDVPGGPADVGAATWGNGTTGVTGTISALNSLIGSSASDQVGSGFTSLTNDNYVVRSINWDIPGGAADAGAATWGDGTTGVTGTVSALNSLIGSSASDRVGVVSTLTNGNYVVRTSGWDIPGGPAGVGAATWGDGTTGITGTVSALNSLIGSRASDSVGQVFRESPDGSYYLISSSNWDNGAFTNAGATTWMDAATGRTLYGLYGTVSAQNSLVGGASSSDMGTTAQFGTVSDLFVVEFSADTSDSRNGRVRVGIYDPNSMTFERAQGQDMSVLPEFLTTFLDAGTNVEIQANNDITISDPIAVSGGGNGGDLALTAGRSVAIDANISTDNGSLTVTANDPSAVSAERDAGDADITIGAGVTINTGSGNLTLQIQGTTDAGSIDLGVGSSLTTSTGDILLVAGTDITASGAASIISASMGSIILVVDNAFPTAPSFGSGRFDIADVTISSDGTVQLYAGEFGLSTFPASINGTSYTAGSGVDEERGVYYPDGVGGTPFTVFYKTESPSPPPSTAGGSPTEEQKNKGKFRYFSSMSEAFMRWTPYSYLGVDGFRVYAPMSTMYDCFFPYLLIYHQGDLINKSKAKEIKRKGGFKRFLDQER